MHALLLAALFTRAAIDDAVRLVMRTQHAAGLSVGVVRHGETVYRRGFGWADLGRRTPARAGTVYRIGSLTKAFTAAAVLQLQQSGKLRLEDSAAQYVSPFPWPREVTIGELLAQRSGIPSYTDTALDRSAAYTPEQLVGAVSSEPLLFAPGSLFSYSNTNYVLLGMIVERESGMPFGAYLQYAVLSPAQLTHTRYGDQSGEARGYARDWLNMPVRRSSLSYAFSAAGMTSNVPDLLRWIMRAQEPYYGFLPAELYGYSVLYATGNVDGYSAIELLAPRERDGLVVLTNADKLDLLPLAQSILAAIEPPKEGTYAHGFAPPQNEDLRETAQVRGIVAGLQQGRIDRAQLTRAYSDSLTQTEVDRLRERLAPASSIQTVEFAGREITPEGSKVTYRVNFSDGTRIALAVRYSTQHLVDGITLQQP
jgi:CubicO group peptidase (beta-lactamase class C family)